MSENTNYKQLNQQLKSSLIAITASELHGFLTGLLAGSNIDESWQPLLFDMANNGEKFPNDCMQLTQQCYQEIKQQLEDNDFTFQLLLNEEDLFAQIEDLVGWINHFLLGIGLAQPQLAKIKGNIGEIIYDLREITKLTYDKDDDVKDLSFAFEEIREYVRMSAILCHDEFNIDNNNTSTLH